MVEAPKRRVLMVEDEPDIQTIAALSLRTVGGFEVEVCSSGGEALARAVAFRPDLILMDVMMPGMTGPETLRAMRHIPELRAVPVVYMTAKVRTGEVEELKATGAAGIIAKPFDPMALSAQVAEYLKGEQGSR